MDETERIDMNGDTLDTLNREALQSIAGGVIDFGALPPEINSARMYAGSGSAPMFAAATAWEGLASDLSTAATSYDSVIQGLARQAWQGTSAEAMTAGNPYRSWLGNQTG